MTDDQSLRSRIDRGEVIAAPLVLNPLMAKMAEAAGFSAGYVGGGALGYWKACTEANLNLPDLCQVAIDIRAASKLRLILDGACGFGEPMHMHRTVGMAEAAGYEAIEIEDQLYPKRVHHHIGIEHLIPMDLMVAKIQEVVSARRSRNFLVIGRTNAMRATNMDDALHRAEAYRKAGADLIFPALAREPEELRTLARHIGRPLMYITGRGGLADFEMSLQDLSSLGYQLIADAMTPVIDAYSAWKAIYDNLAKGFGEGASANSKQEREARASSEKSMRAVLDLDRLIAIERATVEK